MTQRHFSVKGEGKVFRQRRLLPEGMHHGKRRLSNRTAEAAFGAAQGCQRAGRFGLVPQVFQDVGLRAKFSRHQKAFSGIEPNTGLGQQGEGFRPLQYAPGRQEFPPASR